MIENFLTQLNAGEISEPFGAVAEYTEYPPMPVNKKEVLRYAGIYGVKDGEISEQTEEVFEKAVELLSGKCKFLVGFKPVLIRRDEEGFPILPINQHSENLKKNLTDCEAAVFFSATIGSGIDGLIRRYEKANAPLALMLQALGAERVESLCNLFNEEIKAEAEAFGRTTHPRFSPGFGDLPITVQKEFLGILDASRRMGITLSESFLMAPSKSVTAIIGITKKL